MSLHLRSHSVPTIVSRNQYLQLFLCYSLLVLLATPTPSSAREDPTCFALPASSLQADLTCSREYSNVLALNTNSSEYLIEFKALLETPLIPSVVSCKLFLKKLMDSKGLRKKLPEKICLTPLQDSIPAGLYALDDPALEDLCVETGYCANHILDFFSADQRLRECHPHKSLGDIVADMKPQFRVAAPRVLTHVDIALFPFVPLLEEFRSYADDLEDGGAVFASTMSLGKGSATHLLLDARQSPDIERLVLLDAGLAVSDNGAFLPTYFSERHPFHALPITSGRHFDTIFHWKMIFSSLRSKASLSSLNISNPEKTRFIDAIYRFTDLSAIEALRSRYFNAARAQCQHVEDFTCLSEAALEEESASAFQEMSARACQFLATSDYSFQSAGADDSFIDPQRKNIEPYVRNLIDSATSEVTIFSHKFSLRGVARSLVNAKNRGVTVKAFLSRPPQLTKIDRSIFFDSKSAQVQTLPEPHLKAMIIDRKLLFFGTGNFTRNAFFKARELYGITDDRNAIHKALQVAAVLARAHGLDHRSAAGAARPVANWIVLNNSSSTCFPYCNPAPQEPWLRYYRKASTQGKAILTRCNLDHLLFVPQEDLLACLAQNSSV